MTRENHSIRRYRGAIPPQAADIMPATQTDPRVVDMIIDTFGPSTAMTIEGPPIYLGQEHPQLPQICR